MGVVGLGAWAGGDVPPLRAALALCGHAPSARVVAARHEALPGLASQARATHFWRLAAEAGDVDAQRRLAGRLRLGLGAPRDEAGAFLWLQRAARAGDPEAQVAVAASYQLGEAGPRDVVAARRWYERAALGGHVGAMLALAYLHQGGEGHPRNHAMALRWYLQAAEAGSPAAQFHMGLLREGAAGCAPAPVEAYGWYLLAAEQRHNLAVTGAAAVRVRLRPDQAQAAQAWVRAWKHRHGRPQGTPAVPLDQPSAPLA
jgi:TPR repeat protein